ncbi:ATP-binding protein [Marinobacter sp. SS21]|uniref:ATP-binding protein n=1 Tax=Marinobacter sp. SS21 TaxID=2979460 RepID=UPI00232FCCE0|nr:ATP-binding protein [Marinobacter sp. SS21]MDC0662088.1 ATP-binding protein [Marinobacter sp. SS21]
MSSRIELDVQQSLDGVLAWMTGRLHLLGVGPSHAHDCKVIVDEYVANLSTHGRVSKKSQIWSLEVVRDNDDLLLRFRDNGGAFDPTCHDVSVDEKGIADRPVGGLGLLLIKELSDTQVYRYRDGQNCLDVKIHLTREK